MVRPTGSTLTFGASTITENCGPSSLARGELSATVVVVAVATVVGGAADDGVTAGVASGAIVTGALAMVAGGTERTETDLVVPVRTEKMARTLPTRRRVAASIQRLKGDPNGPPFSTRDVRR